MRDEIHFAALYLFTHLYGLADGMGTKQQHCEIQYESSEKRSVQARHQQYSEGDYRCMAPKIDRLTQQRLALSARVNSVGSWVSVLIKLARVPTETTPCPERVASQNES